MFLFGCFIFLKIDIQWVIQSELGFSLSFSLMNAVTTGMYAFYYAHLDLKSLDFVWADFGNSHFA